MQERLRSAFQKALERWNQLEKKHKFRIIAIGVMLLIAIGVTIYLATRPKMVLLYSNLDYVTLTEVQNSLTNDLGIYSEVRGNRDLYVEEKNAQSSLVHTEANNMIADQGFTYADALNYSTMSTTETIKKENLRRARETYVADTLKLFKGVEGAKVSFVIPDSTSYFLISDEDKEASAYAVLTVNSSFDQGSGEAIARIISRSVQRLDLKNIEIMDQNFNVIYSGMNQSTNMTALTQLEAKEQYENKLVQKVRAYLAPFSSQTQVIPYIAFDWDYKTETSRKFNTPEGAEEGKGYINQEQTDKSSYTNTAPDAEPGLATNTNTSPTYQTGENANSAAKTDSAIRDFVYDYTDITIDGSVGKIIPEQSKISVIMYREKVYDEEYMTKNDLLNGMTWVEFKEANTGKMDKMTIDPDLVQGLRTGTNIPDLVLDGYIVYSFTDMIVEPFNISSIVIFSILAILILLLALALLRVSKPQEIIDVEPELSVEDLLVSTQLEEQQMSSVEKLREIEFGEDSEIKKQIDKFVEEKPEAVAQLLRNWLNEDWE